MSVIAWFAGTRIGRWLAMVAGALAILAAAVFYGWSRRGQKEAEKALEGYKQTRKKVDDEDYLDGDLGVIRERLRNRGKR